MLKFPYEPYDAQRNVVDQLMSFFDKKPSSSPPSSSASVEVFAAEMPTGCGKTLTLLQAALSYQQQVKSKVDGTNAKAIDAFFSARSPVLALKKAHVTKKKKSGSGDDDEAVDAWTAPKLFFKQFRKDSTKRLRVEKSDGSGKLNSSFNMPVCTIFYATRTHAQVSQAVSELRKFESQHENASYMGQLRMNILGSRERYCIHPLVRRQMENKALPNENNNLGEICDKLVDQNQCEMVESFMQLAEGALVMPVNNGGVASVRRANGGSGGGCCGNFSSTRGGTATMMNNNAMKGWNKSSRVWDIEDLVEEGVAQKSCPYYAARELVFYADINFCTYNYLLDPIIRKECKFERAVKNNAIVIFDEAHNVGAVCQDALSMTLSRQSLRRIIEEDFSKLTSAQQATDPFLYSYPRGFQLQEDGPSMSQLFDFFTDVLRRLLRWFETTFPAPNGMPLSGHHQQPQHEAANTRIPTSSFITNALGLPTISSSIQREWLNNFKQIYGVLSSLGVTFNPFDISIWGLGIVKRLLLILRFMLCENERAAARHGTLQQPFAVWASKDEVQLICLDGGLGFHHLASAAFRVVLASGTLAPFAQLSKDLRVELPLATNTFSCAHVVNTRVQCRSIVVKRLPLLTSSTTEQQGVVPLRCTRDTLRQETFTDALGHLIATLAPSSPGGVLVFTPNYSTNKTLAKATQNALRLLMKKQRAHRQHEGTSNTMPDGNTKVGLEYLLTFEETSNKQQFTDDFERFKRRCERRLPTLYFAVHRGKLSEGIDFKDHMARLVFCVGIPYGPLMDNGVVSQREYSGEEWYSIDAVRCANQAVGRLIRHQQDFGCAVFLDERFAEASTRQYLSSWVQEITTIADDHDVAPECSGGIDGTKNAYSTGLQQNVEGFFARHLQLLAQQQPKQGSSSNNGMLAEENSLGYHSSTNGLRTLQQGAQSTIGGAGASAADTNSGSINKYKSMYQRTVVVPRKTRPNMQPPHTIEGEAATTTAGGNHHLQGSKRQHRLPKDSLYGSGLRSGPQTPRSQTPMSVTPPSSPQQQKRTLLEPLPSHNGMSAVQSIGFVNEGTTSSLCGLDPPSPDPDAQAALVMKMKAESGEFLLDNVAATSFSCGDGDNSMSDPLLFTCDDGGRSGALVGDVQPPKRFKQEFR